MSSENKPRSAFARLFGRGKKAEPDPEIQTPEKSPEIAQGSDSSAVEPIIAEQPLREEPSELVAKQEGTANEQIVSEKSLADESIQSEISVAFSPAENSIEDDKPSEDVVPNVAIDAQLAEGADSELADEVSSATAASTSADETKSSQESTEKKGLFARWRNGLGKTRSGLGNAFSSLLRGRKKIDEDLIEEIETLLLTADVGIDTTAHLIELFRERVKRGADSDQDLMTIFRKLLVELLEEQAQEQAGLAAAETSSAKPSVIMMVGVNGVGKTTSIGKLAKKLQSQGKQVMLAAGDTFRAAAVEQLQVWGERNQVPVVAQATGADSASVIYDALDSAKAREFDVLIADTAGRLHNKSNLMDELSKVVRVAKKLDETAPHEILLVLDAATGQNALNQAREFCKSVPVTGLILTKLDGTAKGGIVFSLVQQLQLPVKFVGLGEGIDDLAEFNAERFIDAMFDTVDS